MKPLKRNHDFKALPLMLNKDSEEPQIIYFKEHLVQKQSADRPPGKTLFLLNIPPYADKQGLINAFSKAGKVVSVEFLLKPGAEVKDKVTFTVSKVEPKFRVAYLVFNKVAELDKALKLTELQPMNINNYEIKTGVKKWIEEYNDQVIIPKILKEKIEEFMKHHDSEKDKEKNKEKKVAEEDDDGWVTVTKHGKVQSFARTEKVENKIMEKEERGKKRKELKNFYTFQIRESKMKNIVALRQKFEEDKRKIAQIKQSRRFKPF